MAEQISAPPPPAPARGKRPPRRAPGTGATVAAAERPVARVALDVPLSHLDRPFDYLVPAEHAETAVAGARVRVMFAGRQVDGFILERRDESDHGGKLAFLRTLVSPEPVLAPQVAALARQVADRYAGTLADVLRLAVPPRHARVEKVRPEPAAADGDDPAPAGPPAPPPASAPPGPPGPPGPPPGEWRRYPGGADFFAALRSGAAPRAVWWAPPGPAWPAMIAALVAATWDAGRGALVIVPDHRDSDRVAAALAAEPALGALAAEEIVVLRSDLGPQERYRRFLAVSRGQARIVVGTLAAVFAPVADLGLVVVWDDGDDIHSFNLAPYPHVRDVAVLRARGEGCALVIGAFSPSTEADALRRVGWAGALRPRAPRELSARVEAIGSDAELARDPAARAARLPSLAVRAAREALAAGAPVLVQVPRRGYQPSLACASCRRPARCRECGGPLGRRAATAVPSCGWCARPAAAGRTAWRCRGCGGTDVRVSVVGARRTAEELGRAFPRVPVRTSGRDEVLATVPAEPAIVIATPGAEPVADDGYGAVLLLDAWALLGRPELRAGEEALRRWCAAAALARPAARGGRVVVTADGGLAPVAALVRWDPGWLVEREADERAELGFPPATRFASVEGLAAAVEELLAAAPLPAGAVTLGPVPLAAHPGGRGAAGGGGPAGGSPADDAGERERMLVRVPRAQGGELARALAVARGVHSARKGEPVRVQLDPLSPL